ncbi:alcohol dehydrogenase-like protein [Paraburkholderia sp. BL23I1N1]|nr:alcohol dehydrogenase-like protein [Paraburkholderia sp. BL23I1N1]
MFKGILIEKDATGCHATLKDIDESQLPDGDVTIRVSYSTLNYKDGLAITGRSPVVRKFPMLPGIDLVGVVEDSCHVDYRAGDQVLLNGWGVGEQHCGALAQKVSRPRGDVLFGRAAIAKDLAR